MGHRVIIIEALRAPLEEPEVRDHLTTAQCSKVDQILAGPQPCSDEDFRYLQRRLARVYCAED